MTRSLTEATLVDATTEELLTYLRSGAANTHALTRSFEFDGLDIDDWERLKRIHFCLSNDVQAFVADIPDRVRRIKTEHQREHVRSRGEVRGSINWSGTLREWSDTGYADRSTFVCNTPYTEYDIAENRVLKRLLWQVHRTVTGDLGGVDYDWRRAAWPDLDINRFDRLYTQNIHLNRIPDGQSITVTGTDLTTARRSRLQLYTDAYDLYDRYQRLQADTFTEDIATLLAETLIVPADTPTLFELYCCFRLLRHLTAATAPFTLVPIDGDTTALAHLETDEKRIELYHDSVGSLRFSEPLDTETPPAQSQFKRYHDALTDYSTAREALTGSDHDPTLYSGRPDIVVEVYDITREPPQLESVLLGEVKHSANAQTFNQGLEELLTYRQFAAHDGYLVDDPGITVTALLITNGYETPGESDTVSHLNGSDLLGDASALQSVDGMARYLSPGRGPHTVG